MRYTFLSSLRWAVVLLLLVPVHTALAQDDHSSDDKYADGNPDAIGHSADGHYWDLTPMGKIELPRIFLVRDASGRMGLEFYGSSHAAMETGNYTLVKEDGSLMSAAEAEASIAPHSYLYYQMVPHTGEMVIDFSITRQLLFVFFVSILVIIMGMRLASKYKKGVGRTEAPKGPWQNMLEVIIIFVRDEVAKPTIGPKYRKYLPYMLSLFFFILLGNLLGLVPFGVTATSHIMVTGTLAFLTFIITQFSGTKDYWMHILWPPNVPVPIKFILIPVEILGIFTKPIALAFRLFGNMISGHLVLVSILGLIFIFAAKIGSGAGFAAVALSIPLAIFMYGLKLIVSFIQAYIFVMLTGVFIGVALEEHDHAHDHEHGHAHG